MYTHLYAGRERELKRQHRSMIAHIERTAMRFARNNGARMKQVWHKSIVSAAYIYMYYIATSRELIRAQCASAELKPKIKVLPCDSLINYRALERSGCCYRAEGDCSPALSTFHSFVFLFRVAFFLSFNGRFLPLAPFKAGCSNGPDKATIMKLCVARFIVRFSSCRKVARLCG